MNRTSASGTALRLPTTFALVLLLLAGAIASARAQGQGPNAVLVLNCNDPASMRQVIAQVNSVGGHIHHIFPTHVLIGAVPEGAAQAFATDSRVDLISYGYVDPASIPSAYGPAARDAVSAWNAVFVTGEALATSPLPPGRPLIGDARVPPAPPMGASEAGAPAPPGATSSQTSEYMMGSVVVSLVFAESNGSIDPQTENWTGGEQSSVVSEVVAGLNWWVSQYPYSVAPLSFTYVYNYAVPTGYEPITRSSDDDRLWIPQLLTALGYPCDSSTYYTAARNYDNDLRNAAGADWAYTIFLVDSSADADGTFSDGYFAYAMLGGPFVVMTYDNDGWGIDRMDSVIAHETGHIFRAGDEYCLIGYACCDAAAYYGYLNIQNTNCNTGVTCLMNTGEVGPVCTVSRQQLGWRDTDADTLPDILDVKPTGILDPFAPDPSPGNILLYTGAASVGYYPNLLYPGYDVTLNRLTNVEWRVDGGSWQGATAIDGTFDEGSETFTFTTAPLAPGTHTFEIRATDTAGNVTQPPYPSDTVTVTTVTLAVNAGPDKLILPGGNCVLEGSRLGGVAPFTYAWTPVTNLDLPTILQPTCTAGVTRIYTLTVTDSTPVTPQVASDTVTVTIFGDVSTTTSGVVTAVMRNRATSISIVMNNTGSTIWTAAGGYTLKNAEGTWGVPAGGVALAVGDSIGPGQSKTFTFNITAPNVTTYLTGTLPCSFRMDNTAVPFGATSTNNVDLYSFVDVPANLSYWKHVEAIFAAGITAGVGVDGLGRPLYGPISTTTRAMMAVFLVRATGKGVLMNPVPTFGDVGLLASYYGHVERLADAASWAPGPAPTAGCGGGNYCPNDTCTRAMAAVFLVRATGKLVLNNPIPTFSDVGLLDSYYGHVERLADAASWGPLPQQPPTQGCGGGKYCPLDACTRAMMAVYLARGFGLPH